ncbi:hypothetical protein AYI69_g10382, partial [Smittium culicis]
MTETIVGENKSEYSNSAISKPQSAYINNYIDQKNVDKI